MTDNEREALLAEADRWPAGLPDDPTPAASPHDMIARLAAAVRRSEVPEPSAEPSDARVLAALNEWYGGPKDSSLGDYSQMAENAMRSALRAASAVTEQGENR